MEYSGGKFHEVLFGLKHQERLPRDLVRELGLVGFGSIHLVSD